MGAIDMEQAVVHGDIAPASIGDDHPPQRTSGGAVGKYFFVGGSVVGQDHLRRNSPRDDAFAVCQHGDWLGVAVCDGVGSRCYSRFGAAFSSHALARGLVEGACGQQYAILDELLPFVAMAKPANQSSAWRQAWSRWLDCYRATFALHEPQRPDWPIMMVDVENESPDSPPVATAPSAAIGGSQDPLEDVMRRAFMWTQASLSEYAAALGLPEQELSTTARAILLNTQTGSTVAGAIGDGALMVLRRSGAFESILEESDAEDPQTTQTINTANLDSELKISLLAAQDSVLAFFAMTDGLSHDLLYTNRAEQARAWGSNVHRLLIKSSQPLDAAAAMTQWLSEYRHTGSWDDRTLVVIAQQPDLER
jgi:hypothetical protein